jgi:anti-anti-sigma factor
MQIRMRVMRGALVVRPRGDLTAAAAAELLHEIETTLAAAPRDVVLNLHDVDCVDVGALPYVFRIRQSTQAAGGRLTVADPSDSALRLFAGTHVDQSLDLATSEDEALRGVTIG